MAAAAAKFPDLDGNRPLGLKRQFGRRHDLKFCREMKRPNGASDET